MLEFSYLPSNQLKPLKKNKQKLKTFFIKKKKGYQAMHCTITTTLKMETWKNLTEVLRSYVSTSAPLQYKWWFEYIIFSHNMQLDSGLPTFFLALSPGKVKGSLATKLTILLYFWTHNVKNGYYRKWRSNVQKLEKWNWWEPWMDAQHQRLWNENMRE